MTRPFSQACENNKVAILAQLRTALSGCSNVLEVGSGTGQHAVYFGRELPHLRWQTSDLPGNHPGINSWLAEFGLANVRPPLALNVAELNWPAGFDAVFTANTLHIMAWDQVEDFFRGVGLVLEPGGVLCVYGPFNYRGRFTSASNARFDQWLKQRDPDSGIRDFEALDQLATAQQLVLRDDVAMPANNRLLIWSVRDCPPD